MSYICVKRSDTQHIGGQKDFQRILSAGEEEENTLRLASESSLHEVGTRADGRVGGEVNALQMCRWQRHVGPACRT